MPSCCGSSMALGAALDVCVTDSTGATGMLCAKREPPEIQLLAMGGFIY